MGLWLLLPALLLLLLAGARVVYPLPYRELIINEAGKNDLDPMLVAAVIRVESRFDPVARSQRGAVGLMQIMPSTGEWIAEKMGRQPPGIAELEDPAVNVPLGTWYLADLMEEFGRLEVALAAYNAGRGHVAQWLADGRRSEGDPTLEWIPFPETRSFVGRVLRDYRRYRWLYPHLAASAPAMPQAAHIAGEPALWYHWVR